MMSLQRYYDKLNGSRALVTGGTGQIGRRLVTALVKCGVKVSVMTRSPQSGSKIFNGLPLEFRQGDVTEPANLARVLNGIDIVFHLASFSGDSTRKINLYENSEHWKVTALGTENMVKAVLVSSCRSLVYFSSVKAMGEEAGALGYPDTETAASKPETLYGQAKLAAEKAIISAGSHSQLSTTILRLPMVYGLEGAGNLGSMIDAVARRHFPPFPKISNRRSAVHADDAIQAALRAATNPRASGSLYIVTDGKGYSTRWIYEQICLGLGRDIPKWTLPFWCWKLAAELGNLAERRFRIHSPLTSDSLRKLFGDAWFSSNRIEQELGFKPQFALDSEIETLAKSYLEKHRADPNV